MVVWLSTPVVEAAFEDIVIRREQWRSVHRLEHAIKDLQARRDAILDAAEKEAQARIERAEAQAREIQAEAHASGFAQGLEAWQARLLRSGSAQADQLTARRRRLTELVLSLVERVIAAQGGRALFDRAVAEVAKAVETLRYVTLEVAPCDAEAARAALREARETCDALRMLEIVELATLEAGSCRVLTDEGTVDMSLPVQLQALRRMIESSALEMPAERDDG